MSVPASPLPALAMLLNRRRLEPPLRKSDVGDSPIRLAGAHNALENDGMTGIDAPTALAELPDLSMRRCEPSLRAPPASHVRESDVI